MFVFSWMESLHLLEAVQFAWNHPGTAAGSGRTWCHSDAWKKKKKKSSWTKSSDGTPSLTGRVTALLSWTPHLAFLRPELLPWQRLCGQQRSSALWPPGELTFGLRVIKRGQGVSSCWKTVKALHWLAIICPFHTLIYVIGILTNRPFVHC